MINRVCSRMQWILARLTGALFMGLFLVTVLNITLRNLGGIAWLWIPGVSRLLFIWSVFMGTAVLYQRDDHLVMDFFVNKIDPVKRKRFELLKNSIFLIFLILLVIYGFNITKVRMRISFETWKFPTGFAYLAAPVSGLIMIVFCIEKLIYLMKGTINEGGI